ncbi:hypothetical protein CAEBREN_05281 [Caenorhabditis brenneri]|uniref:MATH domain-containing protein n=1 Tax=Caenorhabditis brenneri TaxID=135651 RepID=G0MD33_CAEBE|nr:hypothetical protein CAEBREN_05281 [Caenorhabditis brenneri]
MTTEQVPIKEFTLTSVIRNVSKMNLGITYYTESVNQCNAPCDGKDFSRPFTSTYGNRSEAQGYGVGEFVSIDELCQKLLINDEVVVAAKVQVLEMTGIEKPSSLKCFDDNEAKNMSDGTLLLDDRQFYVSKFKSCLDSLKTAADVRACMGCGGLESDIKDPEVLRSLVDKMLSFMRLK